LSAGGAGAPGGGVGAGASAIALVTEDTSVKMLFVLLASAQQESTAVPIRSTQTLFAGAFATNLDLTAAMSTLLEESNYIR